MLFVCCHGVFIMYRKFVETLPFSLFVLSFLIMNYFICRPCYEQSRSLHFLAVLGLFSLVVRVVMQQMVVHALAQRMKLVCLDDNI